MPVFSLWSAANVQQKQYKKYTHAYVYRQTHTHCLQCQQTVKVCRGMAGFVKCEKKTLSCNDITRAQANKYEHTHGHTPHRFVINFNTRHVKPQVTNDFVPFTSPKPYIQYTHTRTHTDPKVLATELR